MSNTFQREPAMAKENQPNNHQSYSLNMKINRNNSDFYIGKEYSNINVVEEDYRIVEEASIEYEAESDKYTAGSEFMDADSGEPMRKQAIRLDFTPVEGVDDNDDVYKKCQGFWEFLKEHTELHPFKVFPDKNIVEEDDTMPPVETKLKQKNIVATEDHAQGMLAIDWVNREDVMCNAIRTLGHRGYCDLPQEDYCEAREREQKRKMAARNRRIRLDASNIKAATLSPIRAVSKVWSRSRVASRARRTSNYDVDDLVTQMKEWDLQHPRTLDTPCFSYPQSQTRQVSGDAGPRMPDVDGCSVLPCVQTCPCPCPQDTLPSKHDSLPM